MKNHAVIVLRNGDKVLFIQRSATKKSLPNIWAFPSGTMEKGESAGETAAREAKEEIGIDVVVEKELGKVELSDLGARLHFIVCRSNDCDKIICDPAEIQNKRWLTFDEFFDEYSNEQIGHGLIYLRENPNVWKAM